MLGNPNTSQGERSLEDTGKRQQQGRGLEWGPRGPGYKEGPYKTWKLGLGHPKMSEMGVVI